MAVFIIVFTLAAALFFGLRYWGRRMQSQIAAKADTEEGDDSLADNLEFAADMATRVARRARRDDDGAGDGGDGGGGDGG